MNFFLLPLLMPPSSISPLKQYSVELLVSITLSFPPPPTPNLIPCLWSYSCQCMPPLATQTLRVGTWESMLILPFPCIPTPINTLHFFTSLCFLCPILVPTAQFFNQDSCNSPSPFSLGVLQSILCKSAMPTFAVGSQYWGCLLKALVAPQTLSTPGRVVLVVLPQ